MNTCDQLMKIHEDHFSPVKSYQKDLNFITQNGQKKNRLRTGRQELRVLPPKPTCGFNGSEFTTLMRDIFVIGINETRIMDPLFEEDATNVNFEQVVRVALSRQSTIRSHEITGLMEAHVKGSNIYKTSERQGSRETIHQPGKNDWSSKIFNKSTNKCFVCGRNNHRAKNCIYRHFSCQKCVVKSHLALQCKPFNRSSYVEESIFNSRSIH